MVKRRTLLLITEGTSDANALVAPLQKLLDGVQIGDFQVRCDVTTARLFAKDFRQKHRFSPKWNIGQTVDGLIDEYLTQQVKEVTSLGWVAHLTDLDGAYIPDTGILQGPATMSGRLYSTTSIMSPDRDATLRELAEKRRCIDLLVDGKADYRRPIKRSEEWAVPYRLFYMSRNLEHALYGIVHDLDMEEKEDHASNFAMNNLAPGAFRPVLDAMAQMHGGMPDWSSSWAYARDRATFHSLEQGSNLKWVEEFVRTTTARPVPLTQTGRKDSN